MKRVDIENEVRAIKKLCERGVHHNIISVLKFGELPNPAGPCYFIDMELCDLNLEGYIHRREPLSPTESIPYFVKNEAPPTKALQIWNVMSQIANGVKYIHEQKEVHRDIKPANGIFPWLFANCSSLFTEGFSVEIGRLWIHFRRYITEFCLLSVW